MFPASVLAKHLASVIDEKRTDPASAPKGAVHNMLAFFALAQRRVHGGVNEHFRLIESLVTPAANAPKMLKVYEAITSRLALEWTIPDSGLGHLRETQAFFERLHRRGQEAVQQPIIFNVSDSTTS